VGPASPAHLESSDALVSSPRPSAVVVLAAGEGTRMRSATPKVLHDVAGRTLLQHVLVAVAGLDPEQTVVVAGDTPLLTGATLADLIATHADAGAAATVLTAVLGDPTGYGRVVRGASGQVVAIVEHKDADDAQRAVREVNSGVYAFDPAALRDALGRLSTDNAQGEEYLTDVLGLHVAAGLPVAAVATQDAEEILGVNDRVQLAHARAVLRDRVNDSWMRAGVTIVDPATTWIDSDVVLEPDSRIERNTALHGRTSVAAGAVVGPDSTLVDVVVHEGASVVRTHGTGAEIGPRATVGPFSYLRPGTRLGAGAKIGAYVEAKNAVVGDDSKVPHLSYVGDVEIGVGSNVGAATATPTSGPAPAGTGDGSNEDSHEEQPQ